MIFGSVTNHLTSFFGHGPSFDLGHGPSFFGHGPSFDHPTLFGLFFGPSFSVR